MPFSTIFLVSFLCRGGFNFFKVYVYLCDDKNKYYKNMTPLYILLTFCKTVQFPFWDIFPFLFYDILWKWQLRADYIKKIMGTLIFILSWQIRLHIFMVCSKMLWNLYICNVAGLGQLTYALHHMLIKFLWWKQQKSISTQCIVINHSHKVFRILRATSPYSEPQFSPPVLTPCLSSAMNTPKLYLLCPWWSECFCMSDKIGAKL